MSAIYHLALASDWAAAVEAGEYTVSTLGRTLAEEGFIHASTAEQWPATRDRFYSGVSEPLVLLVIDPALLTSELRVEYVPEADQEFPHLYGPLNLDAVTEVRPI
ncbi:MAG: DUF952 domain-containing protein [Nocardioidaceae bacterium]|nr:DUF952 domain-containing protein [Nocardioidaceae bacterium]